MLTLIVLIVFPFIILQAWKNVRAAKKSMTWLSVSGVVTSAERGKAVWRTQPRVTYSYSVNGVSYDGKRVSFAAMVPSRETDPTLSRYPVGQAVTVRYAPNDPAQSVLEPGATRHVVAPMRGLIIIFAVLILVNIGGVAVKRLEPAKPHLHTYDDVVAADSGLGDRMIRQDAEKGSAQDQFYVGLWYVTGHGVAKDPVEAAKWLRKSADQGYADAQVLLGELYAKGNGVPKNPEEAVALFRKAAAQQNIRAYVDLGYSYEKGFGVPQDLRLAGEWFRKAKGNPQAEAGLKRLGAAANQ
jgi:uncharacterized protein DUF3592/Sel1 repeat-containing protein